MENELKIRMFEVITTGLNDFYGGKGEKRTLSDHRLVYAIKQGYIQENPIKYVQHTHTPKYPKIGHVIHYMDIFPSLEEVLADSLPPRHWKPGTVSSYSNYGTALAGFIIEQVTNVPFEQYIQHNILDVLNLEQTTFNKYPPKCSC